MCIFSEEILKFIVFIIKLKSKAFYWINRIFYEYKVSCFIEMEVFVVVCISVITF